MSDQAIGMSPIEVNLSPDAFHRWATHYYKCKQDFKPPHPFSPVPYFLLCRAIELEIKARHLAAKKQSQVKTEYGHNIMRAYEHLDREHKILSDNELEVLKRANEIYSAKGFEYFMPMDALTGYSRYPDLQSLDEIVRKLIGDAA